MLKTTKSLVSLALVLAVICSSTVVAAASNDSHAKDAIESRIRSTEESPDRFAKETSQFIDIDSPKHNAVYYKGEVIPVDITVWDQWEYYYTLPLYGLGNVKTEKAVWANSGTTVDVDSFSYYPDTISTKGLAAGQYRFDVFTIAVPYSYSDIDDQVELGNEEHARTDITLKVLPAPTALKTVAGKNRVTLTYTKAVGAQKYEIYRSTKKASGYKKIATVTGLKYVDTKANGGAMYYYKVRSLRTVNGTVRSAYSAIKAAIVKPNNTTLTKATPLANGLQATWKKTTGITGYQIQIAPTKTFAKPKLYASPATSTTRKIVKLGKKKTYFVRVRTYKKIAGKNYYSAWSNIRKVVTK